jgi:peptidoglycan-associated lipoprotein
MVILVVTAVMFGCARKPAMTTATAPAPTGATASSRPSSATSGQPAVRPAGQTAAVANRAGGSPATTARPAPSEFVDVADLRDIHFDFDQYVIRPDDAQILDRNADWLKANARDLLLIEGHADERGTNEYNLALGERRAKATMNYLIAHGVAAARITVISYGEERPQCAEHSEACWAKNRRAHFMVKRG